MPAPGSVDPLRPPFPAVARARSDGAGSANPLRASLVGHLLIVTGARACVLFAGWVAAAAARTAVLYSSVVVEVVVAVYGLG